MTPLSLQVLAGLLQAHGPDAAIVSDHPGIEFLLGGVREDLREHTSESGKDGYQLAYYYKITLNPGFDYHLYMKYQKYDKMEPPPMRRSSGSHRR